MARKRMIDPSMWDDEGVGLLSDTAFRVFICCLSNADDEGRIEASSRRIRALAFKFRDDVSLEMVESCLVEIAWNLRRFVRYTVDDREYVALVNWIQYQTIKKPSSSQLPPPPDSVPHQFPTSSPPVENRSLHEVKRSEVKRSEVKRSEVKGAGDITTSESSDSERPKKGKSLERLLCRWREITGSEPISGGYTLEIAHADLTDLGRQYGEKRLLAHMSTVLGKFHDSNGKHPNDIRYFIKACKKDTPPELPTEKAEPRTEEIDTAVLVIQTANKCSLEEAWKTYRKENGLD